MSQTRARQSILLVDRGSGWLAFSRKALTKSVCITKTAKSIAKALRLLQQRHFDLIFVNLRDAEDDSRALCDMAKLQDTHGCHVVILFPTDLTLAKMRGMFRAGVYDCVDKPYDGTTLVALAHRQLREIEALLPLQTETESRGRGSILIVDDDDTWRSLLFRCLADTHDVMAIGDYSSAIQILETQPFDVVILDLRLEDQDDQNLQGMELVRWLNAKKQEQGLATRVIVSSSYGTTQQVRECFKLCTLFDYIPKQSFDKAEYRQIVQQALRAMQATRSATDCLTT
jgi:DNA-binding NtrC family response regulator